MRMHVMRNVAGTASTGTASHSTSMLDVSLLQLQYHVGVQRWALMPVVPYCSKHPWSSSHHNTHALCSGLQCCYCRPVAWLGHAV
jgi:hypothetical protein